MSNPQEARILFVINDLNFFLSHRLALAQELIKRGYQVHIGAPFDSNACTALKSHGCEVHRIHLSRFSFNPFLELVAAISVLSLIFRVRPVVLHNVTIKAVLYGTISALIFRKTKIVNAISGLGFVFLSEGLIAKLRRSFIILIYRIIFSSKNVQVIFQNESDRSFFLDQKISSTSNSFIIPGSGVDIAFSNLPDLTISSPISVLIAARILKEKGFLELMGATLKLWKEESAFHLVICGELPLGNPGAIAQSVVDTWKDYPFVSFLGKTASILEAMNSAQICCLPSYREGYSRFLVEALAAGRAIITTNVPGCRELVDDNINGLLVPPRDSEALYKSLSRLIKCPEVISSMGRRSRIKFIHLGLDNDTFVRQTLSVYQLQD